MYPSIGGFNKKNSDEPHTRPPIKIFMSLNDFSDHLGNFKNFHLKKMTKILRKFPYQSVIGGQISPA